MSIEQTKHFYGFRVTNIQQQFLSRQQILKNVKLFSLFSIFCFSDEQYFK